MPYDIIYFYLAKKVIILEIDIILNSDLVDALFMQRFTLKKKKCISYIFRMADVKKCLTLNSLKPVNFIPNLQETKVFLFSDKKRKCLCIFTAARRTRQMEPLRN